MQCNAFPSECISKNHAAFSAPLALAPDALFLIRVVREVVLVPLGAGRVYVRTAGRAALGHLTIRGAVRALLDRKKREWSELKSW